MGLDAVWGCNSGKGVSHLHWLVLSLVGLISSFLFLPSGFFFLLFDSTVICWTQASKEQRNIIRALRFLLENIYKVSVAL